MMGRRRKWETAVCNKTQTTHTYIAQWYLLSQSVTPVSDRGEKKWQDPPAYFILGPLSSKINRGLLCSDLWWYKKEKKVLVLTPQTACVPHFPLVFGTYTWVSVGYRRPLQHAVAPSSDPYVNESQGDVGFGGANHDVQQGIPVSNSHESMEVG